MRYSVMQQSKECWGPDAREWNPERWFAADAASKEKYWLIVRFDSSLLQAVNSC